MRDTATGKVTGRINPPRSAGFAGLAATAATARSSRRRPGHRLQRRPADQFRLNALGAPGRPWCRCISRYPGASLRVSGDLAIMPNGGTIAYDTSLCGKGGIISTEGEVGVISLATRHARVWAVRGANPIPGQIIDLSLSADGSRWDTAANIAGTGGCCSRPPAGWSPRPSSMAGTSPGRCLPRTGAGSSHGLPELPGPHAAAPRYFGSSSCRPAPAWLLRVVHVVDRTLRSRVPAQAAADGGCQVLIAGRRLPASSWSSAPVSKPATGRDRIHDHCLVSRSAMTRRTGIVGTAGW